MQTQTLNISLPKDLVKKVDETAKKEYRNRSEFIREAVRVYLDKLRSWEEVFDYGQDRGRKMGIKSEEDINKIVSKYRRGK